MVEPVKEQEIIDLTLAETRFMLKGVDGVVKPFFIQELSGVSLEAYLDENKDRVETETDDAGKTKIKSIKSYTGAFTSLLRFTLVDEQRKPVSDDFINQLPGRVAKKLFDEAQQLSGLAGEKGN